MTLDLKAIKERAEKATPGPCSLTIDRSNYGFPLQTVRCLIHVGEGKTRGNAFASVSLGGDGAISSRDEDIIANGEFIKHAFTDIPALITEAERLEAENARLREALEEIALDESVMERRGVACRESVPWECEYDNHVTIARAALSAQEGK
jgi:hypothetical protein